MKCPKCGSEIPDDSEYCNKCGSKMKKEISNDAFAYMCPICKTPNPKSATYCVKCGHWLLDSNFQAIPLSEKEFYNLIKSENHTEQKKKKSIMPTIYALFFILLLIVPKDFKILLSLMVVLYGVINIIVPLKKLSINKRSIGAAILLIGIAITMICSINYGKTNTPAINTKEYKSQCNSIVYKNLAHETEKYINDKVKLTGQVKYVQETGSKIMLLINVTKDNYNIYKDTIWVNYTPKTGDKHIIENDIINIWGTVKGRKSYKTVLGNQEILPEIDAAIIEIVK